MQVIKSVRLDGHFAEDLLDHLHVKRRWPLFDGHRHEFVHALDAEIRRPEYQWLNPKIAVPIANLPVNLGKRGFTSMPVKNNISKGQIEGMDGIEDRHRKQHP